jgi:hypothetical protein
MSVDVYDCDPAVVYDENFPRARVDHVCCACSETIRRGDRYARVTMIGERGDKPITWKRCLRCQKIHEHLREVCTRETGGEQWPDEKLNCGHEYRELWGKNPPPEIAALAFALPGEVTR